MNNLTEKERCILIDLALKANPDAIIYPVSLEPGQSMDFTWCLEMRYTHGEKEKKRIKLTKRNIKHYLKKVVKFTN